MTTGVARKDREVAIQTGENEEEFRGTLTTLSAATPPDDLTPRLWLLCLTWLLLLVALQTVIFWLRLPYDLTPDQDIVLAYNALVMNSGLPQEYFDHTGYIYLLLLAPWLELLRFVGFLPIDRLTELPPATDTVDFENTWQAIIEAGRLYTAAIIAVFAIGFAVLSGRLVDDRRIGIFAGVALAISAGAISQIGIMRTEVLSAFFVTASVLLAAVAGSGRWVAFRFLLLGLAALSGTLAVLTKVFAVLPLAAVPLIALVFGSSVSTPKETQLTRRRRAVVLVGVAVIVAVPATVLVHAGFSGLDKATYSYWPFTGSPLAFYQVLFPLWIMACVAAFAFLWKAPLADSISAIAAIVIGASLGLMVLLVRYNIQNVVAAMHPVEHMFVFATWRDPSLGDQATVLGGTLFTKLLDNAGTVIAERFKGPSGDNVFLLEIFIVASLAVGVWARDRRWVLQSGLLLLISFGLQVAFLFRYNPDAYIYHIYSDPFTILAAAVVLARLRVSLSTFIGSIAVVGGLVLYGWWGLRSESIWSTFGPRDPTEFCTYWSYVHRLERFPFCPDLTD